MWYYLYTAVLLYQEISKVSPNHINSYFERSNVCSESHNSVTLTKEERLRRKAESTDPIPIRLTNNYAFHRVFKKP